MKEMALCSFSSCKNFVSSYLQLLSSFFHLFAFSHNWYYVFIISSQKRKEYKKFKNEKMKRHTKRHISFLYYNHIIKGGGAWKRCDLWGKNVIGI